MLASSDPVASRGVPGAAAHVLTILLCPRRRRMDWPVTASHTAPNLSDDTLYSWLWHVSAGRGHRLRACCRPTTPGPARRPCARSARQNSRSRQTRSTGLGAVSGGGAAQRRTDLLVERGRGHHRALAVELAAEDVALVSAQLHDRRVQVRRPRRALSHNRAAARPAERHQVLAGSGARGAGP